MKNQKVRISRILKYIKPESLFLLISLLNGLIYIALNSLSIWLTASLVNNVLSDYDKLVQDHKLMMDKNFLSVNFQKVITKFQKKTILLSKLIFFLLKLFHFHLSERQLNRISPI